MADARKYPDLFGYGRLLREHQDSPGAPGQKCDVCGGRAERLEFECLKCGRKHVLCTDCGVQFGRKFVKKSEADQPALLVTLRKSAVYRVDQCPGPMKLARKMMGG